MQPMPMIVPRPVSKTKAARPDCWLDGRLLASLWPVPGLFGKTGQHPARSESRVSGLIASRLALLTALLVLAAPAARGALTVYTDPAAFQAALAAGAYVEDFTDPAFHSQATYGFSGPSPATTYAYTAAAAGGLYQLTVGPYVSGPPEITTGLSTMTDLAPLSLTLTSGNVTAVGGFFFINDVSEAPTDGDFTLKVTDSDGTVEYPITSTSTLPLPFRGFVSDKLITKVELTTTISNAYNAITHLSVGANSH